MGVHIGALTVDEGTVLCADVTGNVALEPNISKLNEYTGVLLTNDLTEGKNFFDGELRKLASLDFDDLVNQAKVSFEEFCKRKQGKIISVNIVGYTKNFETRTYHSLFFNGLKTNIIELNPTVAFSADNSLALYIAHKVYTRNLSIKIATYLAAYIIKQYNVVYLTQGKDVNIATISRDGFRQLNEEELKEVKTKVQSIDIELRKSCFNLFIKEPVKE